MNLEMSYLGAPHTNSEDTTCKLFFLIKKYENVILKNERRITVRNIINYFAIRICNMIKIVTK